MQKLMNDQSGGILYVALALSGDLCSAPVYKRVSKHLLLLNILKKC